MTVALLLVVAYFLGSLPFGLWLARSEGVDLRTSGSGSIGATNVLRTTGGSLAAVVLVLDSGKGLLAVWLARLLDGTPDAMVGSAVAVVIGHLFPIWAGFRGGKGVATSAGAWVLITPVAVVWAVVVFGTTVATTRYVSAGSMAAAVALPVMTLVLDGRLVSFVGALVLASLIVWRHRANLGRLANGTEPRVGMPGARARRRGPFVG
jgi:glycerol-3-phosphate acyltransferase PlsY